MRIIAAAALSKVKKISDNYCRHCGCEKHSCACEGENSVYLPDIAGVYIYGGRVRADILDLKFNNYRHLAEIYGMEMAERCAVVFSNIDFDAVTFVPMTQSSFDKRGYNQSQLLAEKVAQQLFVPAEDLFFKTRETLIQHELSGEKRIENVMNSVKLKSSADVKGKNILICDDVKTTGATLNQCVEALVNGGAEKVCCICIALTEFLK